MDTEIKVLGVFPVQAVVTDLAEVFRQETGHTGRLTFTTSGVIRQRLAAGEPVDVIILNDYEIDELVDIATVLDFQYRRSRQDKPTSNFRCPRRLT